MGAHHFVVYYVVCYVVYVGHFVLRTTLLCIVVCLFGLPSHNMCIVGCMPHIFYYGLLDVHLVTVTRWYVLLDTCWLCVRVHISSDLV